MEFDFSKLQEAASDLASKAVKGVNYVAQKGKEKYNRFTLENDLSKAQRQLGAYYYNQVKMGAEHESAMTECIAKIDSILDQLNSLDEDAQPADETVSEEKTCPVCGATVEKDAVFCSKCGTKL